MDPAVRRLRVAVAPLLVACLVGCYPALKTVQPKTSVTVLDSAGAPVEGAVFTLATYQLPFGSPQTNRYAAFNTDADGKLRIPGKREWQLQVLLPDGVAWYEWGYCVESAGFRAHPAPTAELGKPVVVVLKRSDRPSRCLWPSGNDSYWEVTAQEN